MTNHTSTAATAKQISFLTSLANKRYGTQFNHLSQIARHAGDNRLKGNMTKAMASTLIEEFKNA